MGGAQGVNPIRRAGRALAATATLLVVTVSAAACSSGGQGYEQAAPTGPPAGFKTYQGPGFSIAHPDAWTIGEKPSSTGGPPVISILGPNGTGGFPPQIAVGHDTDYSSDFDDALEVFRLVSIGRTGQVVSDQPVELAGADRAQRTEYLTRQVGTDGRQHIIRVIEIHALTPARAMYDVLVRAPQEDFDGAGLATALDSFHLRSA